MSFKKFRELINQRAGLLQKHPELYVVDIDKEELYNFYQDAFPAGTNEIYRERREHDCSTCGNFIRNFGRVVAIVNNKIVTVWDVDAQDEYKIVAEAMDELIKSKPIKRIYRSAEPKYGNSSNQELLENGKVVTWTHFEVQNTGKFYSKNAGAEIGGVDAAIGVLRRGMLEISTSSLDLVIELAESSSFYKCEEKLPILKAFKEMQEYYLNLSEEDRMMYEWQNYNKFGAGIKNDVIGTLLLDLSSGVPLEIAIKSYETKVAPNNYKRTSAPITKRMVQEAEKDIEALGYTSALQRRYATLEDINVNDVIWVNKDSAKSMQGTLPSISNLLSGSTVQNSKSGTSTTISIENFISNILPSAENVEVMIKNSQEGNFCSLIAPVDKDSKNLLQWDNNFSWSYKGGVTDSIKAKVKSAGGNVTGVIRCSLAWYNFDDLDLHMQEPKGTICYSSKRSDYTTGFLDVDMNAGSGTTREPVENICYTKVPPDGIYTLKVHQFNKREHKDVGFEVEVEINGAVHNFTYNREVNGIIDVCTIKVTGSGKHIEVKPSRHVTTSSTPKDIWGVQTNTWVKLHTLVYSPNYWNGQQKGNKHYMFMLKDCKNPDEQRGLYNEFLSSDLHKHRKVFEVLGSKMLVPYSDDQLSGVGFSSTKRDELSVKVDGREYEVKF